MLMGLTKFHMLACWVLGSQRFWLHDLGVGDYYQLGVHLPGVLPQQQSYSICVKMTVLSEYGLAASETEPWTIPAKDCDSDKPACKAHLLGLQWLGGHCGLSCWKDVTRNLEAPKPAMIHEIPQPQECPPRHGAQLRQLGLQTPRV